MTFEEELKLRFEEELDSINEMEKQGSEVFNHKLNYQQKLTVTRLKKLDFFLNYSDTGAGKTKAAISSAFYLGAKHILVFCPKQVMSTWEQQITEAKFVDSENVAIGYTIKNYKDGCTFEVFNYDKFNTEVRASKRIERLLNSKTYDLIVFDEIHRLKNKNSETYKQIFKLVNILRRTNPNVKFLGATATPITTSNADLQGIYEILSGKQADELTMGNLASKLLNANKVLETSGFGYFPKSVITVRYNDIDGNHLFESEQNRDEIFNTELAKIDGTSIEEDCIKNKSNISKIEELHLELKFEAYKHLIKKGTVIYTEYTYGDTILFNLKYLVENECNLTTCIYSGEYKETDSGNSIEEFIKGNKDVLIATKSMCEGVDGLQKVSNRVILHTVPSVWSVMHQLIGRFDRQGSNFVAEGVDVYVPMVVFTLNDSTTVSFDGRRWNKAMMRKINDDIVKGGHLEEISIAEKRDMIDDVVSKLKDKYEMTELPRKNVEFDIDNNEIERKERVKSIINDFNQRGKITDSEKLHKELEKYPSLWFEYHNARDERMKEWNEIPYEHIASKIKNKNSVVADFGCGMNRMKDCIPNNKVYAFDHVAIDDSVIACNMAHTPLDDESVDVAVFSLSLWGNYEDYFKEAYRILNFGGLVHIAEPSKSYNEDKINELIEMLKRNGFVKVGDIENRGKFFYLTFMKM